VDPRVGRIAFETLFDQPLTRAELRLRPWGVGIPPHHAATNGVNLALVSGMWRRLAPRKLGQVRLRSFSLSAESSGVSLRQHQGRLAIEHLLVADRADRRQCDPAPRSVELLDRGPRDHGVADPDGGEEAQALVDVYRSWPGRRVPSTVDTRLAVSMPCAIRLSNIVRLANSSSRCKGLVSPETPANIKRSASVIVLLNTAVIPMAKSSKA
jgi:hypothetical protein